jgi:hypothetical protein
MRVKRRSATRPCCKSDDSVQINIDEAAIPAYSDRIEDWGRALAAKTAWRSNALGGCGLGLARCCLMEGSSFQMCAYASGMAPAISENPILISLD